MAWMVGLGESRWLNRSLRRAVLLVVVVMVAWGCGGDSDEGSSAGSETVPLDLSGELLVPADLEGRWESDVPQRRETDAGVRDVGPWCPEGETVELDVTETIGAPGNASASLERDDGDESLTLSETLYHDPVGEGFEAMRTMLDSCVGKSWEEDRDPMHYLGLERLELPDVGEEAVGYVSVAAHGEEGSDERGEGEEDLYGLVRTGEVTMLLRLNRDCCRERSDDDMLAEIMEAAVARLEDGTWEAGVLVPPEVDDPAAVVVTGAGQITVTGNGGCQLSEEPASFASEIFAYEEFARNFHPNLRWFFEHLFELDEDLSLQILGDKILINGVGADGGQVTEEDTQDLMQRIVALLGNRDICPAADPVTSTTTTVASNPPPSTTTAPSSTTTAPVSETTARAEPTLEVGDEVFDVNELVVGQCFDSSTFADRSAADFGTITVSDCAGPHDAEVFHLATMPDGPDAPYPGEEAIFDKIDAICIPAFKEYIEMDYYDSRLEFDVFMLDEVAWSKYDDRQITCFLIEADLSKLTGAKAGAAE